MGKGRRTGGKEQPRKWASGFGPMTPRKGMTQGMTRVGEYRQKVRLAGSLHKSGVPTYTGPLNGFQKPLVERQSHIVPQNSVLREKVLLKQRQTRKVCQIVSAIHLP